MLTRRNAIQASVAAALMPGGAWARHARGAAVGGSAPSGTPNISALAAIALGVPDWNAFLAGTGGKAWAINTAFSDPSGAVLRRLTNRSTLANGNSCGMEYSEGSARISRPFTSGSNTYYWVCFLDATSGKYYVVKYQYGAGVVAGSLFTDASWPTNGGNLGTCFSMLPGEEHIMFVCNKTGAAIHRYDVNAQAYASNGIFSGTNASYGYTGGNGGAGWIQVSWAGDRLVWQDSWAGQPASVYCLIISGGSAGTLYQYSGSPTGQMQVQGAVVTSATTTTVTVSSASWSPGPDGTGLWANVGVSITFTSGVNAGLSRNITHNTSTTITCAAFPAAPSAGDTFNILGINEIHTFRGSTNAVVIEADTGKGQFPAIWFPESGVTTQLVGNGASYDDYGGHADAGARVQYTLNPNGTLYEGVDTIQSYSIGSAPGADGGSYTGTVTTLYGTTAATSIDNGSADGHFNMTWDQSSAAVGDEWTLRDSNGDYYPATAASWSVSSGSIYQTSVTFDSHYSQSSRGVVGVVLWNGTSGVGSQYTGSLTKAASLGVMTAGSYFWSGTTLYAWMPDSSSPSGKVIISSAALQTWFIGYYREDGTDARALCPTYSVTQDTQANYYSGPYPNASPDGLVVIFNSDLGTYDGFVDLVAAEVPTT